MRLVTIVPGPHQPAQRKHRTPCLLQRYMLFGVPPLSHAFRGPLPGFKDLAGYFRKICIARVALVLGDIARLADDSTDITENISM